MSHKCTACRGSGRIGEGYKPYVKFRSREIETLDYLLTNAIENSHSEEMIEDLTILRDRLYKPEPRKDL